jgi:hypothetical protein
MKDFITWNDLPAEIKQRMALEQRKQLGIVQLDNFKQNIPFIRIPIDQTFDWIKTKEGFDFWYEVLHLGKFNVFYKKYSKKEDVSKKIELCISKLNNYLTNI